MFAQVVKSLILKIKNIAILATKVLKNILEAGYICQVSFVYVVVTNHINPVNWQRENLWIDRENTGKTEGILRIEQGDLGVKCYALFHELSIYCCKEHICLLFIHKSHFKDQSNDAFIFIMSKLRYMYMC